MDMVLTICSDALSRHLRSCTTAQLDIKTLKYFESIATKKQVRDKRACDNCASLKLKCTVTAMFPCEQCRRRSITCTCTRAGYADMYEGFRIGKEQSLPSREVTCQQRLEPLPVVVDLRPDSPQPDGSQIEATESQEDNAPKDSASYGLSEQTNITTTAPGMVDLFPLAYSGTESSRMTSEADSTDWLSMEFPVTNFDFNTQVDFTFAPNFNTNLLFDMTQQEVPLVSDNWAYATGEGTASFDNLVFSRCIAC